jgi:hypothetical protein
VLRAGKSGGNSSVNDEKGVYGFTFYHTTRVIEQAGIAPRYESNL